MTKPEEVRELIEQLRGFRGGWGGGLLAGEMRLDDLGDKAATTLDQLLRENERLREGLTRIEQKFGHCETCGTPCEGFTYCDCARPTWAPDDPVEVARATLNQKDTSHE